MIRSHVLICGGTGCTSSGSDKIQEAFETELAKAGLSDEIKIVRTGCFGLCAVGPVVIVHPDGTFYSRVQAADVEEIVNEHLLKGRPVKRLEYKDVDETVRDKVNVSLNDTTFYKTQKRVALRNCGVIDPENIDEYIAMDGYQALGKVLTEHDPGRRHQDNPRTPVCADAAAADSRPVRKWMFAQGFRHGQEVCRLQRRRGRPRRVHGPIRS